MAAQVGRIDRGLADHIGDEPSVARIVANDDGGLVNAGMYQQGSFNLARLDAEAANLHLGVQPAEEIKGAVRSPADQIAGAVKPLANGERVWHEPLGGEGGAAEIAARKAGAANVKLSRDPDRGRLQLRVENEDLGVRDRPANRNPSVGVLRPHRMTGAECRGFGRPVGVDQTAGPEMRAGPPDGPRRTPTGPRQPE